MQYKLLSFILASIFFSQDFDAQCIVADSPSSSNGSFMTVNGDDPSISENDFIDINGTIFFSATDGISGLELWKIDGMTNEIVFIKDINPGRDGSSPSNFGEVNGKLIFTADEPSSGMELWQSDGTEVGTFLIKDIKPGSSGSFPSQLTSAGDQFYFAADDGVNSNELWKSDGTSSGTILVKNINPSDDGAIFPSDGGSFPRGISSFGQKVIFAAFTPSSGTELMISDGTDSGTTILKDINPGSTGSINSGNPGSFPNWITTDGNTIYFAANDGSNGHELWVSDGTTAGTMMVHDIAPGSLGSDPKGFTFFNGDLYFSANDRINGFELWKTDATFTSLLKDINSGTSSSSPSDFIEFNSRLYFSARGQNGTKLWSTDGTSVGTTELAVASAPAFSTPSLFETSSNYLYFRAIDNLNGRELWRTDGSSSGTEILGNIAADDLSSNPLSLAAIGDDVFCRATDHIHGYEMWKYEDSSQKFFMVDDINAVGIFNMSNLSCSGNQITFLSKQDECYDIFELDLNSNVMASLMIDQGTLDCIDNYIGSINAIHYFEGTSEATGRELWRSDGTTSGTFVVKDIKPGNQSSFINMPIIINDKIYFSADNGVNGIELWMSDGTEAGTTFLDITPGSEGSFIGEITVVGTQIFFLSKGEPWVTDGTLNGTRQLSTHQSFLLTPFKDGIIFTSAPSSSGWEAWISDGTVNGTILIKDIIPGPGSSDAQSFVSIGNQAFFMANNGQTSLELWITDGTDTGTFLVKDINPGINSSEIRNMEQISNNEILFSADDGLNGSELWKSDGTSAGTMLVADLNPGPQSSHPQYFLKDGQNIYFNALVNNTLQVWSTDGTAGGTVQITNFSEDIATSSGTGEMVICGAELYVVNASPTSLVDIYQVSCDPVDCVTSQVNIWKGPTNGTWQTALNWDQMLVPTYCDDVIIPAGSQVIIDDSQIATCRTLDVNINATLESLPNAELDVKPN